MGKSLYNGKSELLDFGNGRMEKEKFGEVSFQII